MSIASPTATILQHTAPHRRGPIPFEELETQTPAGRALQGVESVAFNGSDEALGYRDDRELRLAFDRAADCHFNAVGVLANSLLTLPYLTNEAREKVHRILEHVQGYAQADSAEDAAAERGDGRVSRMHAGFKSIAGWCEKSLTAIRTKTREAMR